MAWLRERLGTYRFRRIVSEAEGGLHHFEFEAAGDPLKRAWVLWKAGALDPKAREAVPLPETDGFGITAAARLSLDPAARETITIPAGDDLRCEVGGYPLVLWLERR
jgi:hypothetical protein